MSREALHQNGTRQWLPRDPTWVPAEARTSICKVHGVDGYGRAVALMYGRLPDHPGGVPRSPLTS